MKQNLIKFIGVTLITFVSFAAIAADGDTDVTSYQFGSTGSTITSGVGSSFGTVSIEDNGHNRSAFLIVHGYSYNSGSFNWSGHIPVDSVTVNGVSSMSVEFDTCTYDGEPGSHGECGYVYFTVDTNQPASGWIQNGSTTIDYGLYYVRFAGSYQARRSTSSGHIIGIPVNNSSHAFIGKGQDVEIELVTKP